MGTGVILERASSDAPMIFSPRAISSARFTSPRTARMEFQNA
jgi:hypothetical protein